MTSRSDLLSGTRRAMPVTQQATPAIEVTPDRFGLSIADAVRVSGVGRSSIYEDIKSGALKARKKGRRTLILRADLQAWLDSFPVVKSAA